MNTKDINILFWDNPENFKTRETQIGLGFHEGKCLKYKKVFQFYNDEGFEKIIEELSEDDLFLIFVHVDKSNQDAGAKEFKLVIEDKYNLPEDKRKLITKGGGTGMYDYDKISTSIDTGKVIPFTKKQLFSNENNSKTEINQIHFDYAIIAALYEDEFEQLKSIFEFPEDKELKMPLKTKGDFFVYYEGYLKTNINKKVIIAVQRKTGMVDASIIATQMLEIFTPKYLIMSGVCGGGTENKYGDIILANEVFTFQKGKISDINQKDEFGKIIKLQLFDKNNNIVDYETLFDENGTLINISIEKFEKEPDPIDLNHHIIEKIISKKIEIESEINQSIQKTIFIKTKIEIKIAPIACSTMVINKDGFFEDTIRSINRKTAAVEMESYGVARACHFANKGETTPIIFKSVMDFTKDKVDSKNSINVKAFAAWTSAQFLKCLFEFEII